MRPLAHLARVSAALEVGDAATARRCVAAARELAHPVRTPTGWAHLQFAEAGLGLLDGDLERCRAHAAALRPALQRVRRFNRGQQYGEHSRCRRSRVGRCRRCTRVAGAAVSTAVYRSDQVARGMGARRGRPVRRGTSSTGRLRRTASRRLVEGPPDDCSGARRSTARRRSLSPSSPAVPRTGCRSLHVPRRGRDHTRPGQPGRRGGARRDGRRLVGAARTQSTQRPSPNGWAQHCGSRGRSGCSIRCHRPDRSDSNRSPIAASDDVRMQNQPDLTFYFAVHQAQRQALGRYCDAVATLTERDRVERGKALRRWARGFTLELEEHHYVEDAFFFPSLRSKVASATADPRRSRGAASSARRPPRSLVGHLQGARRAVDPVPSGTGNCGRVRSRVA